MEEQPVKAYVPVVARFDADGRIMPIAIEWENRRYDVERILEKRRVASMRGGGCGIRYRVQIGGRETQIWLEDGETLRWFVERREQ